MTSVWTLAPNENWICDVIVSEWNKYNSDMACSSPYYADVIWLYSDWAWRQVPMNLLKTKKVVTTIHHIVPDKFDYNAQVDFAMRDDLTHAYHVYNQYTYDFIKSLTKKPIHFIHYWANQHTWAKSGLTKNQLRENYGIPLNSFLIGSFQRDTEGLTADSENPQPKLEKGPDLFVDAVKQYATQYSNVHVLLSGWRRQYIIKQLNQLMIPFTYIERPPQSTVRDLYECLDLYVVSSRYEGGPQALIECGLLGVDVVSTPVGIAEQVLQPKSINSNVFLAEPSVPNVEHMKLPHAFEGYRKLFNEI